VIEQIGYSGAREEVGSMPQRAALLGGNLASAIPRHRHKGWTEADDHAGDSARTSVERRRPKIMFGFA